MSDSRLVWSDEEGDLRKKKNAGKTKALDVDETTLLLKLRRLTAGKGRTVTEITGLPANPAWCQKLASELKKSLGSGGSFKEGAIELHGENLEKVGQLLSKRGLKWKKTGG